jgi:hypothetical protein
MAFFAALQTNANCKLEKLILDSNNTNEAATSGKLHCSPSQSNVLLRHTTTLKTFDLVAYLKTLDFGWSIQHITIESWQALFWPLLQNPNSIFEVLDLSDNHITDKVAVVLINALANNSRVQEVDLSYNRDVTITGWVGFLTVLCNPNLALEELYLEGNHINDHVMTSFADTLSNSNMLRELNLDLEIVMLPPWDGWGSRLFYAILIQNWKYLTWEPFPSTIML